MVWGVGMPTCTCSSIHNNIMNYPISLHVHVHVQCRPWWVKAHDLSPYPNTTSHVYQHLYRVLAAIHHIQIDLVMLSFLHPPNMHLLPLYFSHSLLFVIFTFKLFSLLMCICDAFVPSLLTRTIELHCMWQDGMVIMM